MDKKKKMMRLFLLATMMLAFTQGMSAQSVSEIKFCDRNYDYRVGSDSITLFFNVLDNSGKRNSIISEKDLNDWLVVYEKGNPIPNDKRIITQLNGGKRIPAGFTFSVMVDQTIPQEGRRQIYDAVGKLVESAPDSCVYLSFFGDDVSSTKMVTKKTFKDFESLFMKEVGQKYLYSALYAKLAEFDANEGEMESKIRKSSDYAKNTIIAERGKKNEGNNILFVFADGNSQPSDLDELMAQDLKKLMNESSRIFPRSFVLYFNEKGADDGSEDDLDFYIKSIFDFITDPPLSENSIRGNTRKGEYLPCKDIGSVLKNFERIVDEQKYDWAFTYKVDDGKVYNGAVEYTANWKGEDKGKALFSIGSPEHPWPLRPVSAMGAMMKYLIALLVTLLTIVFFIAVMKILIPFIKSKTFASKYYKKYVPKENVNREICWYCKQTLSPGEMVVQRCRHTMHVHCWIANRYRCAEYGQNCTEGIQDHIEWKEIFSMATLRDCFQTIAGILAGLVSWVVYELLGRGAFGGLAKAIAGWALTNEAQKETLMEDCVSKTSAFLTIGLLLGFFLSLIFRYNDEYRSKNLKVYAKILGLSVFSGLVGMLAFAVGAYLFGIILSMAGTTYIPWYCSLPAYLLFSICVSLSLTVKSTIPVKSAMLGGLCSAVIGFLVLYFSRFTSARWGWMNMLLDFIIYGGGLGASLITVRMLAEKYFLVIMNGVRAKTRIPIHKWMGSTGGGHTVTIGMTVGCEIQMNWEKSNNVQKEHAKLYIDPQRALPMLKPLGPSVIYNTRAELPVGKPTVLTNGDTFKIGDTIFKYVED